MTTKTSMEKQSGNEANALLSQSRAERIATLQKPQSIRPMGVWHGGIVGFGIFLNYILQETPDYQISFFIIAFICFVGANLAVWSVINNQQKRIEALTSLLLEQQDR